MTIPKPKHLGPEYADQFKDRSVADAYVNYPPYPAEVFEVLQSLIHDEPRTVLDIGCGTGELARPLAAFVERVDAVDQSAAMIEIGKARKGGDRPNIRWVCRSAEDFPFESPYSLIVAGASLHWMDWYDVLPRMAGALSDSGYLAIVGGHEIDAPWVDDLKSILRTYSTSGDRGSFNVIDQLEHRNLFSVVARRRTAPTKHQMSLERYVDLLHARTGFSRQRMGQESAGKFDAAVRNLVSPYVRGHRLSLEMVSNITWGHPLSGAA